VTRVAGSSLSSLGARDAVFAQLGETGRAEQVARRITDAIILGVLAQGERLPSEAELARRFGVALVTAREALGVLRETRLVETRRGRDGGSFVIASGAPHVTLLETRLHGLALVEISDLAVYFATISAGCAERAAERSTTRDSDRLDAWLRDADFSTEAEARRNAGGFYLELAVLSQSTRLVREQIGLQAEFGPLLWLSMRDAAERERTVITDREIVAAIARNEATVARALVAGQITAMAEWLLAAKARIERGGRLDG
jgi:DNA-binding FadR family transcriptional regulator